MADEPNANADREEWTDRLIDRGLREVVGGETPPEMSQRILTAAGATGSASSAVQAGVASTRAFPRGDRSGFRWAFLAVAASLAVVAAVLVSTTRGLRNAERRRVEFLADRASVAAPEDANPPQDGERIVLQSLEK